MTTLNKNLIAKQTSTIYSRLNEMPKKKYNTSIYTQTDIFKTRAGKPRGSFQTKLET